MLNFLIPITITYTIFYFTYQVFALFVRRRERLQMIERIGRVDLEGQMLTTEQLESMFPKQRSSSALRIGSLLLGVGLGLVVGVLMTPLFSNAIAIFNNQWDVKDILGICWMSMACMGGGLGLLVAHLVEGARGK